MLNQTNGMDWRTCEYWSPHTAYYIWANAVLESLARAEAARTKERGYERRRERFFHWSSDDPP